jgi:hypothetical protein
MKKVYEKDVLEKVKEMINKNEWLNGYVDFADGDLMAIFDAEDYYHIDNLQYINEAENDLSLYNQLKEYDNGIWKYKDFIFIKHWDYGTFVYHLSDTKNYVEHLTMDNMSFRSFSDTIKHLEEKFNA